MTDLSKESNEANSNIISVNVAEDVIIEDKGLGGGSGEMDYAVRKYDEQKKQWLERYVAPHKKKSRLVELSDIDKVLSEGQIMINLCFIPKGQYGSIEAIAHSQIEDVDPLRFFAMPSGLLVVNPIIINHTRDYIDKEEGCMSFTEEKMKKVQRFNKVTVIFQTLVKGDDDKVTLSPFVEEHYNGHIASVMQHECSHLNGSSIYDEDQKAEDCEFLGDGAINIEELKQKYAATR